MAVLVLNLALEESTKKHHGVVRQHFAALCRATGTKASGQTISSTAMVRLLLDGVAEGSVMQNQHGTGAAVLTAGLAAQYECVQTLQAAALRSLQC